MTQAHGDVGGSGEDHPQGSISSHRTVRHAALDELTRGIRLSGVILAHSVWVNGVEAALAGPKPMTEAPDMAVERSNPILRTFERTYRDNDLP